MLATGRVAESSSSSALLRQCILVFTLEKSLICVSDVARYVAFRSPIQVETGKSI